MLICGLRPTHNMDVKRGKHISVFLSPQTVFHLTHFTYFSPN